jgi:hypothetical protein
VPIPVDDIPGAGEGRGTAFEAAVVAVDRRQLVKGRIQN